MPWLNPKVKIVAWTEKAYLNKEGHKLINRVMLVLPGRLAKYCEKLGEGYTMHLIQAQAIKSEYHQILTHWKSDLVNKSWDKPLKWPLNELKSTN